MIGKVWAIQIVCILTVISNVCAGETYSATVRKIIDGDSLVVAVGQDNVEVRLYGVDCPEFDQPYSRDAKNFAGERVLRKMVVIKPVYYDSYGRLVAIVIRDDHVLNKELVQAGLAWVSPRYCKKSFCSSWQASESIARNERRGLWQDERPDPPWQWKRMKKKMRRSPLTY
jgi:endonuclease YncB( thermonuclease family)